MGLPRNLPLFANERGSGREEGPELEHLHEGDRVYGADGKALGKVEQVLTDAQEDRVTEFIVAHGGAVHKTRRRLPARWIYQVREGEVYLAVGSRTVKRLETQRLASRRGTKEMGGKK